MIKIIYALIFLFFLAPGFCQEVKFSPEMYDTWVKMRVGKGEPVYWYCFGEVYAYPTGELLTRMVGVDAARLINVSKDSVIQLNRKIFLYTDKNTNEVLREMNGQKVKHIEYPYQQITYVLKGDKMQSYVTQGSGNRITRMGPGEKTLIRRVGNSYVFTAPIFLNFKTPTGNYEAYENYDFYVFPESSKLEHKYQLSWVRYGAMPPFLGQGQCVIQLVCYRIEKFEDLPNPLKEYIKNEAKLWMNPPRDLNEIAELQK